MALTACQDPGPESAGTQAASKEAQAAETILASVDADASDEPDVVLLAARAHLQRPDATVGDSVDRVRALLRHLEDLAVHREAGAIGWGLSFAWDAFSDGSENPADTVYSYTTAAAGLTYLDAYEVLGEPRYLSLAADAAETLVTEVCCYREGDTTLIWYSDQVSDQQPEYTVYNVNGLALALFSRLDRLSGDGEFAAQRQAILDELLATQGEGLDEEPHDGVAVSEANWRYDSRSGRPNDLIHETFIVEGLLEDGSPDARHAALRSLDGIWKTHFGGTGEPALSTYTQGTRGWGPAAALFMFASTEENAGRAEVIARNVVERLDDVRELEPRGSLWYAMALARHAGGVPGRTPLDAGD